MDVYNIFRGFKKYLNIDTNLTIWTYKEITQTFENESDAKELLTKSSNLDDLNKSIVNKIKPKVVKVEP